MINLSSKSLSSNATRVLNLGLGFVPIPSYNPFQTRIDLFKLVRSIKFFLKKIGSCDNHEPSAFKKNSTFLPNIMEPSIMVFEKMVLKDLKELEASKIKIKHNLSKEQAALLKDLA